MTPLKVEDDELGDPKDRKDSTKCAMLSVSTA